MSREKNKPTRLKHLLESKGMTQRELSLLSDVQLYAINQLATGKKENVHVKTANRICKVMGVNLEYLFGDVL